MNEFYEVRFDDTCRFDNNYFFKSKDKAFSFLWQNFLNVCSEDLTFEELDDIKQDMFDFYCIVDFGQVCVRGFED